MKVHEVLARALLDSDLDVMFGLVGDANLFFAQSFVDQGGVYRSASHEASAVSMADGFARVSQRLGLATVTHGPGLLNTVTALREAVRNRTPLLLVCGDTPSTDRQNIQDVDQAAVVASTGAAYERVRSPATAVEDAAIAVRRAVVENTPVVLDVPLDMQWVDVDYSRSRRRTPAHSPVLPAPASLDAAAGVIASLRRPLILVGRGCLAPSSREAVLELAETVGAPLATTLQAKDLFPPGSGDVGVIGDFATPLGLDVISEADGVLVFGASLNRYTTPHGSLVEGKAIVQCDHDARSIGRWTPVDVAVTGDCEATALAICEMLREGEIESSPFRDRVRERLALSDHQRVGGDGRNGIDIRTATRLLDAGIPEDRLLTFDIGRFVIETSRSLRVDPRWRVFAGLNTGTIGLGVPAGLGAAVAAPGRTSIVVSGDGGFMLGGLNAFNDAVRHGVKLVVLVFNDGSYGAEYVQYRARNVGVELAMFDWPDLAAVAKSLGGDGYTVKTIDELESVMKVIQAPDRATLVDLHIDLDNVPGLDDPNA